MKRTEASEEEAEDEVIMRGQKEKGADQEYEEMSRQGGKMGNAIQKRSAADESWKAVGRRCAEGFVRYWPTWRGSTGEQ